MDIVPLPSLSNSLLPTFLVPFLLTRSSRLLHTFDDVPLLTALVIPSIDSPLPTLASILLPNTQDSLHLPPFAIP